MMGLVPRRKLLPFYVIWASLGIALVFAIFRGQWETAFVALATFGLTIVPFLLQKRYRFHIPLGFTVAIAFFIYATLFLGEVQNFYERFWWWDVVLHTGSAIGFGLIGVVILLLLYQRDKVQAHPLILSLFAFSFAVAIGALWEIFEFAMDQIFGLSMQKSGLVDTMWDLIVDSIGAGIAAVSGYVYLRKGKSGFLSRLIHEGVTVNLARLRG